MDSTDALNLESIPERLLIIGGGIIGLEMATVYSCSGQQNHRGGNAGSAYPRLRQRSGQAANATDQKAIRQHLPGNPGKKH